MCFWAPTLEGLRKELEGRRISFGPTWNDPPTTLRVITIFLPGKISIRIRQVPPIAPMLQRACEIYIAKTSQKLEYKGESLGVLMVRGVELDLVTKRVAIDSETKERLKEKQENRCSVCHDLRSVISSHELHQSVTRVMGLITLP